MTAFSIRGVDVISKSSSLPIICSIEERKIVTLEATVINQVGQVDTETTTRVLFVLCDECQQFCLRNKTPLVEFVQFNINTTKNADVVVHTSFKR